MDVVGLLVGGVLGLALMKCLFMLRNRWSHDEQGASVFERGAFLLIGVILIFIVFGLVVSIRDAVGI